MICGLIFDLDGTLVDSLPGITASLNRALVAHDLATHPQEDVRRFVGDGSRMLVTRATPATSSEALIDSVETAFKADYDLTWPEGTIPYPGIHDMLMSLQQNGYHLAVLSNKPHPFTVSIVRQLFSGISFDHVQGQETGIPHKPDPTGTLATCKLMALTPQECLFIGDSTIDLATARNAHMPCLAVTWGYHDPAHVVAAGPDGIVNVPEEIAPAVLQLS